MAMSLDLNGGGGPADGGCDYVLVPDAGTGAGDATKDSFLMQEATIDNRGGTRGAKVATESGDAGGRS